jgi:hypothetical protein
VSLIVTAQSVLTGFLVLSGLALIVFVEPRSAGSWRRPPGSDRRPALMAGVLLLVYIAIVIEPLREWFDLSRCRGGSPGARGVTLVWALLLRTAWRGCWLQRFLGLDLSRDAARLRRASRPASRANSQGLRPLSTHAPCAA